MTVRRTLIVRLGQLLRRRGQAARGLRLTLHVNGGATWEISHRMSEASAHHEDLRPLACRLTDPPASGAAG
ncbi:hypothetical protein ACF1G5_37070 [Streptomyces coeruleorubidus]|uniref:DinB/UmuC family translesion DNA polymerase n=1 Tax=Streptomyces coeruleorubidus TaxID=116188 RepID=UPI0036FA6382